MNALKQYLPLCLFRINPLDLPKSYDFFKQNLFFYFIVEFIIQANMIDTTEALIEVVIETSLTVCFISLILFMSKNQHLLLQILTSVLFCENVVAVFGVPTVIWITASDSLFSYIMGGLLIFWDYSLITYILKKVLSINMSASLTLSFFYFMMTYVGAYGITTLVY